MSMNVYFRGVAVHLDEWQQKFFHADRPAMNESKGYSRTHKVIFQRPLMASVIDLLDSFSPNSIDP